jgi:hypothetical protein
MWADSEPPKKDGIFLYIIVNVVDLKAGPGNSPRRQVRKVGRMIEREIRPPRLGRDIQSNAFYSTGRLPLTGQRFSECLVPIFLQSEE